MVVTAAVWLGVIFLVRFLLHRAFAAWERRDTAADAAIRASRRTTFSVLTRLVVALVAAVGIWSVLSIFPETEQIARALLASSAVLALFAGLALSTPLGNLGSGVLVAFTQPVRLGDRVTVAGYTGFVEAINLIYTTLVTDEQRRVFLPNTQLTTGPVVNRTLGTARRTVESALPIPIGSSVADARELLLAAARSSPQVDDARVDVGEVTDKLVWLNVTAYAPLDADVNKVASDVRERGLSALAEAGRLPGSS